MKKGLIIIWVLTCFIIGMDGQCYNPSLVNPSGFCIMLYSPVCGCDGHIYGNSCEALNHGITSWSSLNSTVTGPQAICEGDTVQLVASGGNYYTWNNGYHTDSILVSPTSTQNYTVLVYFPGGCQLTKDFTIKVNPSYIISKDRYIQYGDTIINGKNRFYYPGKYYDTLLTVSGCDSIINSNIKLFNWDTCFVSTPDTINVYDTIITNQIDTIFAYVYDSVLISIYDTIIYHDSIFVSIIDSSNLLSINEENVLVLKIYPNPANKFLKIGSPVEISNYQLYNETGELKRNENLFSNEAVIYLENLPKGIYILQLKMENNLMVTRKVIIE